MKKFILSIFFVVLSLVANAYDAELNGIYYNLDATKLTAEVTDAGHIGSYNGQVTIPETVEYQGVTYAVTSIGKGAFAYGQSLVTVTMGNSITKIGASAFAYCYQLENVYLSDNLNDLGANAFLLCKKLKSIVIPDGVTEIKTSTFSECNNLSTAILPKNLKIIEWDAFSSCKSLTEIVIPESVEYIGSSAFSICESLKSLSFPKGLQKLNNSVCMGCSSMETVSIPSTVTYIDGNVFDLCTSLKQVYCYVVSIPEIGKDVFDNQYEIFNLVDLSNTTLYVPASSLEQYKQTSPWSRFGTILPLPDDTGIETMRLAETIYSQYFTIDGKMYEAPRRGINIIKMQNGTTKKMFLK